LTSLGYQDLIGELFPRLAGGIQWGLERSERLLRAAGDPHRRYRVLHVGGTNGKGSVSATIAAVLRAAGFRTGLYTSPHLCTFRERIQMDGRPLEEAALVAAAERIWPTVLREGASFFEATTAIAFLAFADAGVEAAVVEVGLGGRLDATNTVSPELVILTNVSLDHVQYLGSTLEAVAWEKAGIIKPGVPVITAEASAEVREVFRRRAEEVGAPFHALDGTEIADVRVGLDGTRFRLRTTAWGELALHTPLIGAHQAVNAALAVRALELLPAARRPDREAVLRGVRSVRWPGRLQIEQIEGRTWIFDAAHNSAGVAALAAALTSLPLPRPLVALVGVLSDKDWGEMLPVLARVADALVLTTPPSAPEHRRWDPEAVLRGLALPAAEAIPDFEAALAHARAKAGDGSVLVTGSFHTVGDALIQLGRAPFGADAPLPAPSPAA
jgi:dihydrofolate synthase/folylpolyglutamate synthase